MLAMFFGEQGGDRVAAAFPEAWVGAVNLAEIVSKLIDRGWSEEQWRFAISQLLGRAIPFEPAHAVHAGILRAATGTVGLSLGDRACLALARSLGATAMTADRAWAGLDVGVAIEIVR